MMGEFFDDVDVYTFDEFVKKEIADEIEWENDARFSDADPPLTRFGEQVVETRVRVNLLKGNGLFVRSDGKVEVRKRR